MTDQTIPPDATIAVVDLETTGVIESPADLDHHRVYEIGAVIRVPGEPDREYHRWIDLTDLAGVDLSPDGPNKVALSIGRFHDRHPQWNGDLVAAMSGVRREEEVAAELVELLDRATLAGVQVGSHDAPSLDAMLARHGRKRSWSYRHTEISTYATAGLGLLVSPGLDDLLAGYGIAVDPQERHTALGDARLECLLLDAAATRLRLAGLAGAVELGDNPEDRCHRCGGPNVVWFAPSPLWNQVMRGGSINGVAPWSGIVCPTCFVQLAEAAGVASMWRLSAEKVNVELETVTPSGRVWNPDTWLWETPVATEGADAP